MAGHLLWPGTGVHQRTFSSETSSYGDLNCKELSTVESGSCTEMILVPLLRIVPRFDFCEVSELCFARLPELLLVG